MRYVVLGAGIAAMVLAVWLAIQTTHPEPPSAPTEIPPASPTVVVPTPDAQP